MTPKPRRILQLAPIMLAIAATLTAARPAFSAVMPPAEEGVAHVNHVDLHYRCQGTGEPVVFIHGMLGNYQDWDPYTAALATKYRIITYSRRYNWPNTNQFSVSRDPIADDRDDLYWLIRKFHIVKAHIVGDSYGAAVALAFSVKYPAFTASITLIQPRLMRWLVDMPSEADTWQRFVDTVYVPAKRDMLGGKSEAATNMYLEFDYPDGNSGIAPTDLEVLHQSSNDLKADLLATGGYPNVDRLDVRKSHVPTLVISAEKAPPYLDALAREVATISGGGPATTIAGASHNVATDDSSAVEADLAVFLKAHPIVP